MAIFGNTYKQKYPRLKVSGIFFFSAIGFNQR